MTINLNRAQRRKLKAVAPKPVKKRVMWNLNLEGRQELFTHINHETGETRVFAVTSMQKFAETHRCLEVKRINVKIDQAHIDVIIARRGIETPRLNRLKDEWRDKPILAALMHDGTFLVIDGNHRILKRWQAGIKNVNAYVFTCPFWESFIIDKYLKKEFVGKLVESTEKESAMRDDCVSYIGRTELGEICREG